MGMTDAENIIARHTTVNDFSIAIIDERAKYIGKSNSYRIVRIDSTGAMITLDWARTEQGAREIANRFWLRDMGLEQMIGCGTLAA